MLKFAIFPTGVYKIDAIARKNASWTWRWPRAGDFFNTKKHGFSSFRSVRDENAPFPLTLWGWGSFQTPLTEVSINKFGRLGANERRGMPKTLPEYRNKAANCPAGWSGSQNVRFGGRVVNFFIRIRTAIHHFLCFFVAISIGNRVFLLLRQFCKHRKGHQTARVFPKKYQKHEIFIEILPKIWKNGVFAWKCCKALFPAGGEKLFQISQKLFQIIQKLFQSGQKLFQSGQKLFHIAQNCSIWWKNCSLGWSKDVGLKHTTAPPWTPQFNPFRERAHDTIVSWQPFSIVASSIGRCLVASVAVCNCICPVVWNYAGGPPVVLIILDPKRCWNSQFSRPEGPPNCEGFP